MRCYQFVCFFVFSSNKLTFITFTDFNLGLTCILDQTFLSFLDLRMLGFPTDFEGIDNENRRDRQSRQCWEFWRENSRTELISWLLTHHDIRNKTDKKNLLYLCIPLGLWSAVCCCLWKRSVMTRGVAWWPFFERSRDRTVDKSRARHVFWNLWEIIIFSLKLRILFWVCALVDSTVWYILMWQDLCSVDLNRDQANLERKYFLFDLKFNLLSFSVFENDLPT